MSEVKAQTPPGGAAQANLTWTLEKVAEALRELQFGLVTLTVQDGVVVQVERTERKRFQRGRAEREN